MSEIEALDHAINALKTLSAEGREYLLDRFWSDAEISAEQKRRIIRRAGQALPLAAIRAPLMQTVGPLVGQEGIPK